MKTQNKKRAFTVNEKLTIINKIERGCSQASICANMKLKKSTVSNIWKKREKIKSDWKINANVKKMRLSSRPQVDEMLYKWYQVQKSNNLPVNGTMLQIKAEEFGKTIGDYFKCSAGWLDRFKKRHDITFDKISGKSTTVDRHIINDWLSQVWPVISNGYSESNIFNAEETDIFFRETPDGTRQKYSEGEISKERITVLVCANGSGNEKRKLLVIGKFPNPRSLCNIKTLPADYADNENSLMTATIFENYLKKWDKELVQQNRKILLLVDSGPAHQEVCLRNIRLEFFPPTVSIVLRPLKQCICSLKQSYRTQMLLRIAELRENNDNKVFSILDAINLLSFEWEKVSSEAIRECFQLAGLLSDRIDSMDIDFDIDTKIDVSKLDDYVGVESNLINTEEVSEYNLLHHEVIIKQEEEEQDYCDDDNELERIVTTEEALCCIKKVRRFFQQEDTDESIFSHLNKIQLALQNECIKSRSIQTNMRDFYTTM